MQAFFRIILLVLVVVTALTALAVYWTMYRSVPSYNESLRISGIADEIVIHRDEFAIPHISAQSETDLYFAAGYVHAQDRMWQMTLYQLMAEGRFAEFFGAELVETDRFLRTIGFYRMAHQLFEALSEEEKDLLVAYSNGVNFWISKNHRNLPIEFALTGISPIPWTPLHSLAIVRLMAWELNQSWWSKSLLHILAEQLSPSQYALLLPKFPRSTVPQFSSMEMEGLQHFVAQDISFRSRFHLEGLGAGSNAWAVDASRSETGFPFLAGDPHLGLALPARWYEIHYSLQGKNASGAMLAGVPLIVLGQTDFAAWSLTNVMLDDTDFFLIATDPHDRGRYVIDSTSRSPNYASFDRVREVIHVSNADDVLHETLWTKFGPVITHIHEHSEFYSEGRMLAMQWTGHQTSNEFRVFRNLMWADNFQDIQKEFPHFGAPAQNIIYADRDGNIAHFVVGYIPRRARPLSLRRSWIPADRWQGMVSFSEHPVEINPERGWVANANQKLVADSYPHYISSFWHPGSRMNRIADLIEAKDKLSLDDHKFIQSDVYSEFAENLADIFLRAIPEHTQDSLLIIVRPYLHNWNYRYERNETAASIIDVSFHMLSEKIFSDFMNDDLSQLFMNLSFPAMNRIYSAMLDRNDPLIPLAQRDSLYRESMRSAVRKLHTTFGPRTYQWRWENVNQLHLKSPLFSDAVEANGSRTLRIIHNNLLSRGPFPISGSNTTLNMSSYSFDFPYTVELGPSIRRIVDFSTPGIAISSVPGGQSGNPMSVYFDDQLQKWLSFDYKRWFTHQSHQQNYQTYTTRFIPE